jgi:plastocyanin
MGAMIFASALPGFAATTSVLVGPSLTDTFSPNIVNINAGDQIIWTWQATFHSTTSGTLSGTPPTATPNPNGIWDSGVVTSLPHSFTNSFPSAGNFPFFCSIHYNFGMTGQVNVAAVALPPTVSITNPVNNATFSAPASFTLAATAASSGGSVTNVQFFQGATSLGNATTSPYSVPVNSLAAADYTFSAVASDNSGLTATNAVTIHVVTPVAIVLSAPQFLPPADFRFNYTANSGLTYVIQRSSSLSSGSWTTLSTNVAGGSPILFDDPAASGNPGFYRVGRMPNP